MGWQTVLLALEDAPAVDEIRARSACAIAKSNISRRGQWAEMPPASSRATQNSLVWARQRRRRDRGWVRQRTATDVI
jgi:hypothetical protein